jgi:hypothetical protein
MIALKKNPFVKNCQNMIAFKKKKKGKIHYPRVRQNLLFHKYIDISKMNTKSLIHVMLGQINISLNIKKYLDIVNIFFKLI